MFVELNEFYSKKQQIMIHLQNTQQQIEEQKAHFQQLDEEMPPELLEKIKQFEEVKKSLIVSSILMCHL